MKEQVDARRSSRRGGSTDEAIQKRTAATKKELHNMNGKTDTRVCGMLLEN